LCRYFDKSALPEIMNNDSLASASSGEFSDGSYHMVVHNQSDPAITLICQMFSGEIGCKLPNLSI
jgi:hypothetical protein